jgi:hypothetical protein
VTHQRYQRNANKPKPFIVQFFHTCDLRMKLPAPVESR